MKLLVNRVSKRILALFLTVVSVFGAFGFRTPVSRIVSAETETAGTYTLVEDATTLATDDQLIIACSTKNVAMGAISTTSTKYGTSIDVTITGNTIIPSSDVKIVTLGGMTGAWTLQTDEGYLCWSSGNSLNVQTDEYNWAIDIDENNDAEITSGERILRYNATSPRFACYTSSQTAIQLYKLVESTGGGR